MRLFGLNNIRVLMAAEPVADVYVRAWNENCAWKLYTLISEVKCHVITRNNTFFSTITQIIQRSL